MRTGWFHGIGSGRAFYRFYGAWWELAKSSDIHFRQVFDEEYEKLLLLVPEAHRQSVWLRTYIYDTHRKWCFAWTWAFCTLGVHSTQRSESLHAIVASLLSNNSTLIDVVCKLETWVDVKSFEAQVKFYVHCTKISSGHPKGRLVSGMTEKFHAHATKLVTANLTRCVEYHVEEIPNSDMFSVKLPIASIQADFLGPVKWVDNMESEIDYDEQLDQVREGVINRLDRAVGVHDYFPLFRKSFISNGEYCSCQYPTMQKLPCEHCLAVIVIKLQLPSLPEFFLQQTPWHKESDETASQFNRWCKTIQLTLEQIAPKKAALSTAATRFTGIMATCRTMAAGFCLLQNVRLHICFFSQFPRFVQFYLYFLRCSGHGLASKPDVFDVSGLEGKICEKMSSI